MSRSTISLPRPKVIVIGNARIEEEIKSNIDLLSLPVEVLFEGGDFEAALEVAEKYKGEADVFITGESIVAKLRERVSIPVVPIPKDGFDYLNAIFKASSIIGTNKEIVVISYGAPIPEIGTLVKVTNFKIKQISYSNIYQIDSIIKKLAQEKIEMIVAPTLPCLIAEKYNIKGISIYSSKTYRNVFAQAANIAISQRKIKYLLEQQRTISNLTDIGVIICDSSGIVTHMNKKASEIVGHDTNIQPAYIKEIFDEEFAGFLESTSRLETKAVRTINDKEVFYSITPVLVNFLVDGFIISCQYTEDISKSEYMIRQKRIRGFKTKYSFDSIIGRNKAQNEFINKAKNFSKVDYTVSIQGESGTGKELVAHAIHNASSRRGGPFIAINCGSIPESILESELFGYESGAFTGSRREGKKGIFELCHSGTLFLDEIGELSHNVQKKLLRFTDEKEIIRVGGSKLIPVDVRIITATNKNLKNEVIDGSFRLDLFQRISILSLKTIPLRERRDDVPELMLHFFRKHSNDKLVLREKHLQLIAAHLKDYHWPGNLRELESLVINFVVTARTASLDYKSIESIIEEFIIHHQRTHAADKVINNDLVHTILKETRNNKSEAARRLGISRTSMWRLTKNMHS